MKIDMINDLNKLAPTLSCDDENDNIFKNVLNEYFKKAEKFKPFMGIEKKYFFGHLHDSKILSLKKNKK
jgi:hypothetical protein